MTKTKLDFLDKLQKLEQEKQILIEKRKEEIFNLIERTGMIAVDNDILVGAFLTIKAALDSKDEKDKKMLEDYKEKSSKFFRRKTKSTS